MQKQQFRQNQLLLLEDVVNTGRKGDVVVVKPGFARNFLLPQKKAVIADKRTLRMQQRLQEERAKQAEIDREESERIKTQIENKIFTTLVKIDPDGNLYGSVSVQDIVDLLSNAGYAIDKRCIRLGKPIKSLGQHKVPLKLKEGVETFVFVKIEGDRPLVEKEVLKEEKEIKEPSSEKTETEEK